MELSDQVEKDCVPCQLSVGLGMMIDLCKTHQFTDINCDKVAEDVVAGRMGFEEAFNTLLTKAREKPASWGEFDQVIKVLEKAGVVK